MTGARSAITVAAFTRHGLCRNLKFSIASAAVDSFASGLIYGFLAGKGAQWAVDCGCAHGALAMTTPGDTTMVTLSEVERVMKGGTARVQR